MTLPKDPDKRAAYIENQRQKARANLLDPEFKRRGDQARAEGLRRPEVRAKISASHKAMHANPANAEKLALHKQQRAEASRKPEVRQRNSERVKAHYSDPEARKLTSEATKQAMARPEVKQRTSATKKAHWADPEIRANFLEGSHRRWERPEEHQKTSEATKAAMVEVNARPEWQENLKRAMQEVRTRPEYHKKLSESQSRRYLDPEAKRKLAEVMAEVRVRPEYREAVAAGIAASKKFSRTDIEIIVESLLQVSEVEYEAQKHIGWWIVDFYIPDKNLVIECDGDYWHNKPEVKARDARKDAYLTRKGYQVLRLLGSQILANQIESLYLALE